MEARSDVLLTGGTGFLGSHILRALQGTKPARTVVLATRAPPPEISAASVSVRHLRLDLTEAVKLPPGLDTVIHVAGEKRDETRMEAVNHHGTERLLQAAATAGVRRFIHVSSVGVYGAPPHAGLINESFRHAPRNRYEASKEAAENRIRERWQYLGMDYLILQPANVIGLVPGRSYPLLGLMRMLRRGWFSWFGESDPWVNYVAVQDVAAAVVAAAAGGAKRQAFIINTPARLRDVIAWACHAMEITPPRRRMPLWLGRSAADVAGVVARLTGRAIPFGPGRFQELIGTTRYDGSAFQRAFGFAYPVGAERLVRDLAHAYRSEGLL